MFISRRHVVERGESPTTRPVEPWQGVNSKKEWGFSVGNWAMKKALRVGGIRKGGSFCCYGYDTQS